MATMVQFLREKEGFVDETYRQRNEAEEEREKEFNAIVKVQAWFRGTRVRLYIRHLNHGATSIQRRWRGFLGRKHVREVVKNQLLIMRLNHYNSMATKVQKVWRGFYVRKYVSNYYSRKRYLEGLKIKNEIIRNELEDYADQQEMLNQVKREKEEKEKLDDFSKRHHYLVSTEVMPGVFNSPYQPYPDEMEFHLRNAKKSLAIDAKKNPKKKENIFDPGHVRYDLPRLKDPLPPLQERPKGPFREPVVVQQQRYKPFQPTLRVATNFYSLDEAREKMKKEEWMTRINDDTFVPFSSHSAPYEKLLHTTSKYGHPSYGTKFFRHEYPIKWLTENKATNNAQFPSVHPDNFNCVVPPIPIFEKMNDTYSQGQV